MPAKLQRYWIRQLELKQGTSSQLILIVILFLKTSKGTSRGSATHKKVYKPRQDASYVSHNLTSVYHHLHSNPPLQSRSEPAPSIRHPLLRVHLQGFNNRHLHAGFARCGPRRAAQGNGTKLLTRLTGSWLTSLAMKVQGNYVVSFSVYVGCCVEVEVRTGRV